MQDLRSEEGVCDGFYLRLSDKIVSSEIRLKEFCNELEIFLIGIGYQFLGSWRMHGFRTTQI